MVDFNAVLKASIYTERLNDMYARISEVLKEKPHSTFCQALRDKRREISIAYKQSRFFCDQEHFDKWENQLMTAEILLKTAEN